MKDAFCTSWSSPGASDNGTTQHVRPDFFLYSDSPPHDLPSLASFEKRMRLSREAVSAWRCPGKA